MTKYESYYMTQLLSGKLFRMHHAIYYSMHYHYGPQKTCQNLLVPLVICNIVIQCISVDRIIVVFSITIIVII